jgi:hypothetical protein
MRYKLIVAVSAGLLLTSFVPMLTSSAPVLAGNSVDPSGTPLQQRVAAEPAVPPIIDPSSAAEPTGAAATGPAGTTAVHWIDFVDGRLRYGHDAAGNRLPDFSQVGYHAGDTAPPHVPVVVSLSATSAGDDTARIQAALTQVAALGKPGAVLLGPGSFRLRGTVVVAGSGVVLRGSGSGDGGTRLVGSGAPHRLVRLAGVGSPVVTGATHKVTDDYVPVGARTLTLDDPGDLRAGDRVVVQRPMTAPWIQNIGMNAIPPRASGTPSKPWRPGPGLSFERRVTEVSGHEVTLDVALPQALEKRFTAATVRTYTFDGRIHEAGLEDLAGDGAAFEADPGWQTSYFASGMVTVDAAEDSWVSDVVARHFGSAFGIGHESLRVSILNTESLDESVPQDIHAQPAAYTISGEQSLVSGCKATGSNFHAWITQAVTAGPDVFTRCSATNTGTRNVDAGPHQRWTAGVLYDDVSVTGSGRLALEDRGSMGTGQGWAAANSVLWNCVAPTYRVEDPPTAHNWAFGCKGALEPAHPGHKVGQVVSTGRPVTPRSLYDQQVAERRSAAGG